MFFREDAAEFVAAVNSALQQVRPSLELDLIDVLCGGPDDIGPNLPSEDIAASLDQRERAREELAATTAGRLIAQWPDVRAGLEKLRDSMAAARRLALAVSYPEIGLALQRVDPGYAEKLAEAIIAEGDETIDYLWRWLHEGNGATEATRRMRLEQARAAFATGRPSLLSALIAGYARWLGDAVALEEERAFGLELAARSEGGLAGEWFTSLRVDAGAPFAYFTELIRQLPAFTPDPNQLRMGFYLVVATTEMPRDEPRRALVAALLDRFVEAPTLGDFVNFRLMKSASRYFDEVRRFLYARLERARSGAAGYEVIPQDFGFLPSIETAADHASWLEEGWREALADEHPHGHSPGHRIFLKMFAHSANALEQFFVSRVAATVDVRELRSVAAVLQQVPGDGVPWMPAVIRAVLLRAKTDFSLHYDEVEETLLDACVPSAWGWEGDQPDADTRTVLENLRRLASEWAHDAVMSGFFIRALAIAEERYRRR